MENASRSTVRSPQLIAERFHAKAMEQERLIFFGHVCNLKTSECFESLSRLGSPFHLLGSGSVNAIVQAGRTPLFGVTGELGSSPPKAC
jgi:hypothetical protein